ncbi:MAG: hypothetical protein ACLQVM_10480 [Terriglobia bacterium]
MTVTPSCAVVVSSCDRYSDAWEPFFTLFFRYWPDCPFPLFMITNGGEFPNPRVKCVTFPEDRGWSGNLIDTLKQVPAEYVLYLQEDYFLKTRVDTEKVSSALDFIRKEAGAYLRLYPCPGPDQCYKDEPEIGAISRDAPYRNCLQAAIWRKDVMFRTLRPGETGWDFELRGGVGRSRLVTEAFLSYRKPVITYICTAILRGRYTYDAVRFCRREGITLDNRGRECENILSYLSRKGRFRQHVKRLIPRVLVDIIRRGFAGRSYRADERG